MGSIVISVDAELAWGVHDLFPLTDEQRHRVSVARDMWHRLVKLFETYDIPATWAVVGHLFTTNGTYRTDHPLGEEWFGTACEGMRRRPDEWLGADLIERVSDSDVSHEIGSHSFSHTVFTDISKETARIECELAQRIGRDNGLNSESFVFPRNAIAHREALADAGFTCYRGTRPRTGPRIPGGQGAAMLGGYLTGTVTPPLVEPTVDEYGLVNVPASMFLGGFRERPWTTLDAVYVDPGTRLAKLGIDAACNRDGILHLWLHPNDLTSERYVERVREVLSYLSRRRQEGMVSVETMGQVARRIR